MKCIIQSSTTSMSNLDQLFRQSIYLHHKCLIGMDKYIKFSFNGTMLEIHYENVGPVGAKGWSACVRELALCSIDLAATDVTDQHGDARVTSQAD